MVKRVKLMPIFEAKNIVKIYQETKKGTKQNVVLQNISFSIKEKEFVIITGPSGSGKTTLLYLLSKLEVPTSGEVYFENKNLNTFTKQDERAFRQDLTGFVFQSYELIPTLTVFDNVALPLIIKGAKVNPDHIFNVLKLVGIEKQARSFPDQLSGGEKQRVAIARSIVHEPKVVFADEPTGNLDKQKAAEIMELFKRINVENGTTIILVTHNLSHLSYGTRVIELSNAHIIREEILHG